MANTALSDSASRAWRPGSRAGRTIYAVQPNRTYYQTDHDVLIGVMDTREIAARACSDHNRAIGKWPPVRAHERGGTRDGSAKDWNWAVA